LSYYEIIGLNICKLKLEVQVLYFKNQIRMDIKKLDQVLLEIAEKKNQLNKLTYADKNYDVVEEELHDLEDDFVDEYGDFLEDALHTVHDEYCPDNDVLLSTAYLAKRYMETGKNSDGTPAYDVDFNEGVLVEVDDYPGQPCKLVIVPNPCRIILQISATQREVVWTLNSI
jgi:hypothetical protein